MFKIANHITCTRIRPNLHGRNRDERARIMFYRPCANASFTTVLLDYKFRTDVRIIKSINDSAVLRGTDGKKMALIHRILLFVNLLYFINIIIIIVNIRDQTIILSYFCQLPKSDFLTITFLHFPFNFTIRSAVRVSY